MTALMSLESNSWKSLYIFGFSSPIEAFAFSILASKRSHRATTLAGVFFAIVPATYVPRLPDPNRPTVTAELAALPRMAANGIIAAALTAFRREMVDLVSVIGPPF